MTDPMIAVLVPTRGTVFTQMMLSTLSQVSNYDYAMFCTSDLPIPDCRNTLVEQAEATGIAFTHYLMIDDDVIMPPGGLDAMLKLDQGVVVIDYPTHWLGEEGKNTGNVAYADDTNQEILWAGLGCTLVKTEVFDKLKKPYFRTGGKYFNRLARGKKVLKGDRISDGGEDYEFFTDCRKVGYPVYQVKGMVAGHAKIMRHIGVLEHGKYIKQHDIMVANQIDKPLK